MKQEPFADLDAGLAWHAAKLGPGSLNTHYGKVTLVVIRMPLGRKLRYWDLPQPITSPVPAPDRFARVSPSVHSITGISIPSC